MKINKKTVSHFLGLAVLFGAVELTHQLTKTEEQVTYSVTLESLANAGGSGTYRRCPPDNPCYRGYHNHTKIIRNFRGNIYSYVRSGSILPAAGFRIAVGASGAFTYCRRSFFLLFWERCYKKLNGWRPFTPPIPDN